ncbi:MAG TPA: oligosaccharide flippase family protein [Candidatus Binatia bacterium]|nr:oligosaccharide flippase family protein [Candidatus Binatia bacterium]
MEEEHATTPLSADPPGLSDRQTLRLAGGAGTSFLGKVLGRLIQVAAQIVFARYLGMHDFGRLALGLVAVRVLGTIAPLGLHRGIVVFGSRYWKVDDARFRAVVFEAIALTLASSLALAAALAAFADAISVHALQGSLSGDQLRSFAKIIPVFAMLRILVDSTRVSQRMHVGAIAEDVTQPLLSLFAFLLLMGAGSGALDAAVQAVFLSFAGAFLLTIPFLLVLFPQLRTGSRPRWNLGELARFAAPSSLAVTFGILGTMLDRMIVGYFRPPHEMGLYQAASQVSIAFTIVVGSFTSIFAPMAARFLAAGDHAALQQLMWRSTRWGLYLSLPVYVFFLVMPGAVLGTTFGDAYAQGAPVLRFLATSQLLLVVSGNLVLLLITSGKQTWWLAFTAFGVALNAVTGTMLVQRHGLIGAAIANTLTIAAVSALVAIAVHRLLHVWPVDRRTLRPLFGGVASLLAGHVCVRSIATDASLAAMVTTAAVVGVTFVGVCWVLGLDEDERVVLRALRGRLVSLRT